MNPVVGFFFKVNNLEIPETIFKEEFDSISNAYFSVLQKLKSLHDEMETVRKLTYEQGNGE